MKLNRFEFREDGIFGELLEDDGTFICKTLEHAYYDGNGGWQPKLPTGNFICKRSQHRLHGMTNDFTTFEVTGVPGHTGILFHWGNYNKDSEGCILVGENLAKGADSWMITNSRATFARFMNNLNAVDAFTLTVLKPSELMEEC